MSTVDLRRFDDALAPLLDRQRWQLESVQARLRRLQARIHAAEHAIEAMQLRHRQVSAELRCIPGKRIEPRAHGASLQWLSQLHRRMAEADEQGAALRTERSLLIAQCRDRQRQIDAIAAHREDCMAAFALEESRRQAIEADRDWLVRAVTSARFDEPMGSPS